MARRWLSIGETPVRGWLSAEVQRWTWHVYIHGLSSETGLVLTIAPKACVHYISDYVCMTSGPTVTHNTFTELFQWMLQSWTDCSGKDEIIQCRFNVGPASQTLAQHWNDIRSMFHACRESCTRNQCNLSIRLFTHLHILHMLGRIALDASVIGGLTTWYHMSPWQRLIDPDWTWQPRDIEPRIQTQPYKATAL